MPTYRITSPDGKKLKVTVPEGVTPEQVMADMGAGDLSPVSASPPASSPAVPNATPPPPQGVAGSAGEAPFDPRADFQARTQAVREGEINELKRMFYGLKQTFAGLTPEQKEEVKKIEAATQEGPYAEEHKKGARSATGLTMLVPGTAAGKYLTGALKALGPAAPIAASALTSGTQEALTTPSTAEDAGDVVKDKLKAGGMAALISGGLSSTIGALSKGATGLFKPTKEAEELMARGITPTLQQGAQGWLGKKIGGLTSGVADVGERQGKEVVNAVMRRIIPGEEVENYTKRELIEAGQNSLERDYANVLRGKSFKLSKAEKEAMNLSLDPKGLDDEARKIVTKQLADVLPERSISNMGQGRMNEIRTKLQERVDALAKDDTVSGKKAREFLEKARDSFDNVVRNPKLTAEEITAVTDIDKRAYDFARVRHAAGKKAGNELSEADLLRAYRDTTSTDEFISGSKSAVKSEILEPAERILGNRTQEESRASLQLARRIAKLGGAATATKLSGGAVAPLYAISGLGQSARGAKALFGQYEGQKRLAELLRQTRGAEAGLGAALYNPEGE